VIHTSMSLNYEPSSEPVGTASERRGNNLKGFKHFYLEAKARIWPWLAYMCHIRPDGAPIPEFGYGDIRVRVFDIWRNCVIYLPKLRPRWCLAPSRHLLDTLSCLVCKDLCTTPGCGSRDVPTPFHPHGGKSMCLFTTRNT